MSNAINAREFEPRHLFPAGTFAARLQGTAREQWKRWYWMKRMNRAERRIVQGELGEFHGVLFFERQKAGR